MSQIFNKSNHPVAVKRIPVRIWALRDEIETALERRIRECEAAGTPLYVDDIKEFYGMSTDKPLSEQPQLKLVEEEASAPEAGPTENVEQMMEALAEVPAEAAAEAPVEATATEEEPSHKADEIIAAQTPAENAQGPTAPHLQKPYSRSAPDLTQVSYGFALLSDVNMDWMLTFSKNKFTQGQSVVIEFLIPRPFMMSSEVMLCSNYGMRSRIISETKPDYRLQCRFTYLNPGERTRLREFLTSIEPDLPKKAQAKPAEEAGPEA